MYRTKRRVVQGNLDLALSEQVRPGAKRKLSYVDGPGAASAILLPWQVGAQR